MSDPADVTRELAKSNFLRDAAVEAAKRGADPQMLASLVRHLGDTFEPDATGQMVPRRNGAVVYSQEDPRRAMPLGEFIELTARECPGFFRPNVGMGTRPGGHSAAAEGGAGELVDPSPTELGKHARAIARGEMRIGRRQ